MRNLEWSERWKLHLKLKLKRLSLNWNSFVSRFSAISFIFFYYHFDYLPLGLWTHRFSLCGSTLRKPFCTMLKVCVSVLGLTLSLHTVLKYACSNKKLKCLPNFHSPTDWQTQSTKERLSFEWPLLLQLSKSQNHISWRGQSFSLERNWVTVCRVEGSLRPPVIEELFFTVQALSDSQNEGIIESLWVTMSKDHGLSVRHRYSWRF